MNIEKSKEELLIKRAEEYLKEYALFRSMEEMNRYEVEYFGKSKKDIDAEGEEYMLPGSKAHIRMKMFEIRRFIFSLGNCNEKLFLFYHYIHGLSVTKCAELMGISRRSAFRLKGRALAFAGKKLDKYFERQTFGVR